MDSCKVVDLFETLNETLKKLSIELELIVESGEVKQEGFHRFRVLQGGVSEMGKIFEDILPIIVDLEPGVLPGKKVGAEIEQLAASLNRIHKTMLETIEQTTLRAIGKIDKSGMERG